MLTLETAIRLIVIGQQVLIATIFLLGGGSRIARVSGTFLVLSVAGYLYNSSPLLRASLPVVIPLATLLAMLVPYCLWSFARAVFEAPWPKPWVTASLIAFVVFAWLVFINEDHLAAIWFNASFAVERVVSIVVVGHAIWLAATGRPDDLVEKRRRFRVFFIVIIAIEVIAVLTVETALVATVPPAWLTLTNVLVIAALTAGLALLLLRTSPDFFVPEAQVAAAAVPDTGSLSPAEAVLQKKLLAVMEEGAYRESGLTIRALAGNLDYPEHQLRRLINGHLGFRNFSAFLNNYRITEARERLADPDRVRTPILTTALDLGYGSLGPFNRAFKEATGMTPTEFRQQSVVNVVSE